jgi:CheY-like chemotaxis protein
VAGIQVTQRVLVVDDVAEIRTLIQRVLSADGYRVDVAATLAEARGMHPAGYAVVVVDSHLGTESGIDLIDELRSADPAAACRCLVITGDQTDASSGLAFLAKPFRAADLLDAVRALPHPAPSTLEPGLGEPRSPGSGPSGSGLPGSGPSGSGLPGTGRPGPEPGTSSAPAPPSGSPPPLSPAPTPAQIRRLLAVTRRLRTRERRELVGFLHDGPIQELTAGTLEAEMMRRSAPAGPVSRVDAVLRQIEAAARALRWLVDGEWPFMQPEVRLAGALRQRSAWLLAEPLTIDIDPGCAGMAAGDVPAVVDVAELMLLAAAPEYYPVRAHLAVRGEPRLIELELTLTVAASASADQAMGDPGAARAALCDLAEALGTVAHTECGAQRRRVRIALGEWGG